MLTGCFGKLKIAEINLNEIRQNKEYNKSAILSKMYVKQKALQFATIRYNKPAFEQIQFNPQLINFSYHEALKQIQPVSVQVADEIIMNNLSNQLKQNYNHRLYPNDPKFLESIELKKENGNGYFFEPVDQSVGPLPIKKVESVSQEERFVGQNSGYFGVAAQSEIMEGPMLMESEVINRTVNMQELIANMKQILPELTEETIKFYIECGCQKDVSSIIEFHRQNQ